MNPRIYDVVVKTIGELVQLYKQGLLVLDPKKVDEQRPFSWTNAAYEMLYQSHVLGIPIGALVVLCVGKLWLCFDGKHRYSATLIDFVLHGKPLVRGGKVWADMSASEQQEFLSRPVPVIVMGRRDDKTVKLTKNVRAQAFIAIQNGVVTSLGEKLHAIDGIVCDVLETLIQSEDMGRVFRRVRGLGAPADQGIVPNEDEGWLGERYSALALAARLLHMEFVGAMKPGSEAQLIKLFESAEIPREAYRGLKHRCAFLSEHLSDIEFQIEQNLLICLYWIVKRHPDMDGDLLRLFTEHLVAELRISKKTIREEVQTDAKREARYQFVLSWDNLRGRTGQLDHIKRYNIVRSEYYRWLRGMKRKTKGEADIIEITEMTVKRTRVKNIA